MLQTEKLQRVLSRMEAEGIPQLLVTDPAAVFWLTGKWIHPGERFLGLLLAKDKEPVLYINALFMFPADIGVRKVYYSDTDSITELLRRDIDPSLPLGVDKILPARFLLPLMESGIAAKFVNGSVLVDAERSLKDETEREKMRAASIINDKAMEQFKGLVYEGVTEKEVAARLEGIYRALGASGHSFDPIVAFGDNAADPHHMPDDTKLREGDIVLFDVGCVLDDYCSDMTRTFFFKKEPDEETKRIYNLVRRANETAESVLRPGIPLCEIDKTARDIITEGGYGPNFTHRLGHFIGVEVHEYGDVSAAFDCPAMPGNVFSIEPGIYAPGTAGVRIEDLVLITETGYEVLNHYPHDIEVIG